MKEIKRNLKGYLPPKAAARNKHRRADLIGYVCSDFSLGGTGGKY
jgi:hypothetical protein